MAKATKDHRSCIWEVRLKSLDSAVRYQFLLSEFGAALRAARGRIEAASGEGREPVVDAVFDYEWEVIEGMPAVVDYEREAIEGMLGMSFVACQLDITSVVSRCLRFHELGPELLGPKPSKQDLRELCRETVTGSAWSKVAAIYAFANYFKHEDEWPVDLGKIKPEHAQTASIVVALGVVPGSSRNMRTGFERILGHTKYERVGELGDLIGKWARGVKGEYKEKLKKKKLLLDV